MNEDVVKTFQDLRSLEIDTSIEKVMGTPDGRRVMYWLCYEFGGIFETSFAKDENDNGRSMAYREGGRARALELAAKIKETAPELYIRMLNEESEVRTKELLAEAG